MRRRGYVTTSEVAKLLGVSTRHVGWLYRKGELRPRRVGGIAGRFTRLDVADVVGYCDARGVAVPAWMREACRGKSQAD